MSDTGGLNAGQIASRVLRSALFLSIGQYVAIGLGVVKGFILARLIDPEYFGIVVLATTWVSFLHVLRMELKEVVVSDSAGNQARIMTALGFELITSLPGIIVAAVVYRVAPSLLSAAHWTAVAAILGIRLVTVLTSIPLYILDRDIRQDIKTYLLVIGAFISLIAAVVLAYRGLYLEALLVDMAIPIVVNGIGAWLASGWLPSLAWDREVARDSMSLGVTLWTGAILGKISFEFDDWLVGTLRGDAALGFYSKAYGLAKMPMDIFAGVIGAIALSLYAQSKQAGQAVLEKAYRLTTWLLMRVVVASSVVMLAATEEMVLILYGRDWLPVVPLIRLMFLYVLGRPLWQNNAQLLIAIRQEKYFQRSYIVQAVLLVVLGPPAVLLWGAEGASMAVNVMMIGGFVVAQRWATKFVPVGVGGLYGLPLLLCLVLTPIVYAAGLPIEVAGVIDIRGLIVEWDAIAGLAVKAVLGLGLFGGLTYLFERSQIGEAVDLVWSRIRGNQSAGLSVDDDKERL